MAMQTVTLSANVISRITPGITNGAPTTVVVRMASGAALTYVTADGNDPVTPSANVTVGANQRALSAQAGDGVVLSVPLVNGQPNPNWTVRLLSAGTPTVTIEW